MAGPTQVTVSISTQSQSMQFGSLPSPQPPTITLDGNALPAPSQKPYWPSGFQVVVLDPTQDITQPAAIVSNEYQQMVVVDDNWGSWYQYMYTNIVKQVLLAGNVQQQLVFVASFGLDLNAPPTNEGAELFLALGANGQLQQWITDAVDAGSQSGDYLTATPANYIVAGNPASNYGEGTELFQTGSDPQPSEVTFQVGNIGPPPDAPA
jgi:hypothetical protein